MLLVKQYKNNYSTPHHKEPSICRHNQYYNPFKDNLFLSLPTEGRQNGSDIKFFIRLDAIPYVQSVRPNPNPNLWSQFWK